MKRVICGIKVEQILESEVPPGVSVAERWAWEAMEGHLPSIGLWIVMPPPNGGTQSETAIVVSSIDELAVISRDVRREFPSCAIIAMDAANPYRNGKIRRAVKQPLAL